MEELVTILMSVYNNESFVGAALESMCNQTYKNLEILVFNDASTDNSAQIIEKYQQSDSRIKFENNQQNCGLTKNLQKGMLLAKGKYIARMDADDIAMPDRIKTQVDFMEKHPDIDILGTSYIPFQDQEEGSEVKQPEGHEAIRCELLLQFTLIHPTVMLRRKSFLEKGLNYDASFRYSQDFDLWERSCRVLHAENLNIPLLRLRSDHAGKISTRKKKPQKECSDRVRRRQLEKLGCDLSNEEIEVFHDFGSHALMYDIDTIRTLDNALIKIIEANDVSRQYDPIILRQRAAELFRWNCIAMNDDCHQACRYYLKSKMRKFDTMPLKIYAIIILKSFGIQ